jgi:hypothetical protein
MIAGKLGNCLKLIPTGSAGATHDQALRLLKPLSDPDKDSLN